MDGSRTSISGAVLVHPPLLRQSRRSPCRLSFFSLLAGTAWRKPEPQSCSRMPGDFLVGSHDAILAVPAGRMGQVRVASYAASRAETNDSNVVYLWRVGWALCKALRGLCVRYSHLTAPSSTVQRSCSQHRTICRQDSLCVHQLAR